MTTNTKTYWTYYFFIRHYNSEVPLYKMDWVKFKQFVDKLDINNMILFSIGTAFLLIDLGDISGCMEESGLAETIKAFTQVHRNSFLLMYAPVNGKKEIEMLSEIQHR